MDPLATRQPDEREEVDRRSTFLRVPLATLRRQVTGGRGKTLKRQIGEAIPQIGWMRVMDNSDLSLLEKSAVGPQMSQVLLRRDGGVEDVCYFVEA